MLIWVLILVAGDNLVNVDLGHTEIVLFTNENQAKDYASRCIGWTYKLVRRRVDAYA